MTGINADLEALEAMYKAVLVEFQECAGWQPILEEARRASECFMGRALLIPARDADVRAGVPCEERKSGMKLELFCKCGAGAEGEIDPRGELPFVAVWNSVHSGESHAPCTKDEARTAYKSKAAISNPA